ncbi:MAG: STAS domain-containing protein [Methanoregula sp.]|nr:STAS domain-containing protein [Methanoregula sp.]
MNPEIATVNSVTIITVVQRFDSVTAPEIEVALKPFVQANPKNLLFDLSRTTYIASAGLRVLLSTTRTITKAGGKVALCSLSPQVRQVFEIGGFLQIFTIYGSRDEALAQMQKQ